MIYAEIEELVVHVFHEDGIIDRAQALRPCFVQNLADRLFLNFHCQSLFLGTITRPVCFLCRIAVLLAAGSTSRLDSHSANAQRGAVSGFS